MASTINGSEFLTAAAVAAIDSRNQSQHKRTKWRDFWSGLWCFGPKKHDKRIVPALVLPEANPVGNQSLQAFVANPPGISLTIMAPPSSPASIFSNTSAIQSPAGLSSACAITVGLNSPCGSTTPNMFAVGPYAHETQLVSPPVFSTMTTEPSTPPITPPPESVHLTTPSSPEVPFAQFFGQMDINCARKYNGLTFYSPITSPYNAINKDLQAFYQLHPGSPASHLISPKSGVTGSSASSPLPESELSARWSSSFSAQDTIFSRYDPSKMFTTEKMLVKKFGLGSDLENTDCGSLEANVDKARFLDRAGEHNNELKISTGAVIEDNLDGSILYAMKSHGSSIDSKLQTQLQTSDYAGDNLESDQFVKHAVSKDKEAAVLNDHQISVSLTTLKSSIIEYFSNTSKNQQLHGRQDLKAPRQQCVFQDTQASLHLSLDKENTVETANPEESTNSEERLHLNMFDSAAHSDEHGSSSSGEFNFDKVDTLNNQNKIKDMWFQHREEMAMQNGIQNWRFFQMMPTGING